MTTQFLHHEWSDGVLYINPDQIAEDKFGGWNDSTAILESAKYCSELRNECIESKRSFVFETVFSAPEKIDFILRAKAAGFFVRLFFIGTTTPTINASRIAKRVIEGGNDVPILFRLVDGRLAKQYVSNVPVWAQKILSEINQDNSHK